MEDKLLIWKFKGGSSEALCRIYRKYGDYLLALAAALLQDVNAAEDIVHDVFVTFIRSCGKMRLNQSLKGYLITCIVNTVRNKNKAGERRESASFEQVVQITSDSNSPDLAAMFNERSQNLAQALSRLPYEQREALLLHLYSGLKFRTIARLENESISTIQGRYRYGLNKLRSLLNGEVEK